MTTDDEGIPAAAFAMALAQLPGCGQNRLRALLHLAGGEPAEAWGLVRSGRAADEARITAAIPRPPEGLVAGWRAKADASLPKRARDLLRASGVGVWIEGEDGYPPALADDPDPPPVLFWRGAPDAVSHPAVALVGTRRCTSYGVDVARELGRDLGAAGVSVVSGLALGIDGAAHEGALAGGGAPPIGVVGSGLDIVYPRRHRSLWQRVGETGLLLSEAPLGAAPEAWRFPQRNRILAGLAAVVVVVESHASGGSLSTVRLAADRDVPVMAVPGSVRSPSSVGTNRLLADGVAPVTDAEDILVALSLAGAVGSVRGPVEDDPQVNREGFTVDGATADPVLAAVDWTPTATEDVLRRTGLGIAELAAALTRLEVAGRVRRVGGWWERAG